MRLSIKVFKDIVEYFRERDVLVFNNTKVFPARLYGNKEKTGAEIEVFLLRELNREQRLWDVLVDPARKIRIGNKLYFGEDDLLVAEVIDNTTSRAELFVSSLTERMRNSSRHFIRSAKLPYPSSSTGRLNLRTMSVTRPFLQSTRERLPHLQPVCISAGNC